MNLPHVALGAQPSPPERRAGGTILSVTDPGARIAAWTERLKGIRLRLASLSEAIRTGAPPVERLPEVISIQADPGALGSSLLRAEIRSLLDRMAVESGRRSLHADTAQLRELVSLLEMMDRRKPCPNQEE